MLIPDQVLYFVQISSLIDEITSVQEMGAESNWTMPLVFYLRNDMLPDKKNSARKLKVQVSQFDLIKDVLYKRGFSRSYLRCLGPKEAYYVMRKIHQGICRNHSGARLLVNS